MVNVDDRAMGKSLDDLLEQVPAKYRGLPLEMLKKYFPKTFEYITPEGETITQTFTKTEIPEWAYWAGGAGLFLLVVMAVKK